MPIEFRCTQCDRLLRTPDGTSGKDAKCPQCGAIVKIPEATSPVATPAAPLPPPLRETTGYANPQNPYQSPIASGAEGVASAFRPTPIDFADIFSRTWALYKRNLGGCIAGVMLIVACSFVINIILQLTFAAAQSNMEGAPLVAMFLLQQVIGQVIGAYFYIGLILFMLKLVRTETADFGALFSGAPFFLFGAVIQVIVALATGLGFVLCIIPGIIVGLMFSQAQYMLVDQRSDILGSLRLSMEATNGNKLMLLAVYLVGGVVSLLVTVLTCGIGLIFAMPYMVLLSAVVYLTLTGQPTALDGAAPRPVAERPFGASGAQPAV